jgi:protein-tyrosine phosphatase
MDEIRSGGSHDALRPSILEGRPGRDQFEGGAISRRVSMNHETEVSSRSIPLRGWDPAGVRSSFGTYRGLVRLILAWAENLAGRYCQFKQIRWERVARVVFVCHGNICRSPYAEGRAVSFGLPAASFGLSADSGAPADPSACRVAARREIELIRHCARDAADFELQTGDLLVAMEPRQARRISGLLPPGSCQLTLLGLWSRPPRPHIHDPHRLSEAYWERCFDVIDSAVQTIADRMHANPPDDV